MRLTTDRKLRAMRDEQTRWKLTVDETTRYSPWEVQSPERLLLEDLQSIRITDLFALGFGNWDDSLMLLPLWVLGMISDGERLVSIGRNEVTVGQDIIDTDTRGGCLAYGFIHPGLRQLKNAAE